MTTGKLGSESKFSFLWERETVFLFTFASLFDHFFLAQPVGIVDSALGVLWPLEGHNSYHLGALLICCQPQTSLTC